MPKTPEEVKDWAEAEEREPGDELVIEEKPENETGAVKITKKTVRKI